MTSQPIIYFLCTGNSCRSQMAEGFGKKYLGSDWDVRSAGIEAHGLNPDAVKAMAEKNIDISNQSSSVINQETLKNSAVVITLCADAKDNCPLVPSYVKKEHWGFPDPARATGTEEEKWIVFQDVRDQIESRIMAFAQSVN